MTNLINKSTYINESIDKLNSEIIDKLNDESFDISYSIRLLILGKIHKDLSEKYLKVTNTESYNLINDKNDILGDSILNIALKKYYNQLTGDFIINKIHEYGYYKDGDEFYDEDYLSSVVIDSKEKGGNTPKNSKKLGVNELDISKLKLSETNEPGIILDRLYHQVMEYHGVDIYDGKSLLGLDSLSSSGFLAPVVIIKKINPRLLKKITELLKNNIRNYESLFGNYNVNNLIGFIKFYEKYPNIVVELKDNPLLDTIVSDTNNGKIELNERLINIYKNYKGLFNSLKNEHSFYHLINKNNTYNNLIKLYKDYPNVLESLKDDNSGVYGENNLTNILSQNELFTKFVGYLENNKDKFEKLIKDNNSLINIFYQKFYNHDPRKEINGKLKIIDNKLTLLKDLEDNHKELYTNLVKSKSIDFILSSNDIYIKFLDFNNKKSELSKLIYTKAPGYFFSFLLSPSNEDNKKNILPNLIKVFNKDNEIIKEIIASSYSADIFTNDNKTDILIDIYYDNKELFNLIKNGYALMYLSKEMVDKFEKYPEKMEILLRKPGGCNFLQILNNDKVFSLSNQDLEKLSSSNDINYFYDQAQKQVVGRELLVDIGRTIQKEKKDISKIILNLLDDGKIPKKYKKILNNHGKSTSKDNREMLDGESICEGGTKTPKEVALQLYFTTLSPNLTGNQLDLKAININESGLKILKDIKILAIKKLKYYDDFKDIEDFEDILYDEKKFKNLLYLGSFKKTFDNNGHNSEGKYVNNNYFNFFINILNFNFILNDKRYIKYFIELNKVSNGRNICENLSKNNDAINIINKFSVQDIIKYNNLLDYYSLKDVTVSQLANKLEEANYINIEL